MHQVDIAKESRRESRILFKQTEGHGVDNAKWQSAKPALKYQLP